MKTAEWDCSLESDEVDPPVIVVPPDERIKPQIRTHLRGDISIRVINQIEGGNDLALCTTLVEEEEPGSRPSSEYSETPSPGVQTALAGQVDPLPSGSVRGMEYSEPVIVRPRPAIIDPPTVRAPPMPVACGCRRG
jgi:hypothetical protein